MRIVDLSDAVAEAIETLREAASRPSHYTDSCGDLPPEELCGHISRLLELSRLATTLGELAVTTLTEEQS